MSDWEKSFEEISDRETVTLTKGQIKKLMKDAALEAVTLEKQKQTQEQEQETTMTKDQIMKVQNRTERQKLIKAHPELFR